MNKKNILIILISFLIFFLNLFYKNGIYISMKYIFIKNKNIDYNLFLLKKKIYILKQKIILLKNKNKNFLEEINYFHKKKIPYKKYFLYEIKS